MEAAEVYKCILAASGTTAVDRWVVLWRVSLNFGLADIQHLPYARGSWAQTALYARQSPLRFDSIDLQPIDILAPCLIKGVAEQPRSL